MPTEKNLTTRDLAMAIRKGDPDALNFFNNWITVHQSDGWLAKRHAYWFDTREWADQVEQN
jgi:polar amino acid transport system substrate-binding protein